MNTQKTLLAGAILGVLGVALGAFGAHALKPMLVTSGRLETFELAVRYEFYHALAMLLVGVLQQSQATSYFKAASIFFLSGIILFSGSLYSLCFSGITALGMITPFGGIFLILGWVFLGWGIYKSKK